MQRRLSKARKGGNRIFERRVASHRKHNRPDVSQGIPDASSTAWTSFSDLPMLKPRSFTDSNDLGETQDRCINQSSIFVPLQILGSYLPNPPLFSKQQFARSCAYLTEGQGTSSGVLEIVSSRGETKGTRGGG